MTSEKYIHPCNNHHNRDTEYFHHPEYSLVPFPTISISTRQPMICLSPEIRSTCTPMFIVALFTIVKTCKQPKCPSTDKWIKKMCVCMYVYIYIQQQNILSIYIQNYIYIYINNRILLSYKKERNNAICSEMDRPRGYYTK